MRGPVSDITDDERAGAGRDTLLSKLRGKVLLPTTTANCSMRGGCYGVFVL